MPASAQAITGNLTVVGQTGAGYVSVTPAAPTADPTTSTLNFPVGDVRANGLSPPGTGGDPASWLVYNGATGKKTHLILDLSGYFE